MPDYQGGAYDQRVPGLRGSSGTGPDLSGIYAVGYGGDDTVRAEVAAGGRLTGLRIDPELLSSGADKVAEAVLEAVHQAQLDSAQQAVERIGSLGAGLGPGGLSEAASAAESGMRRLAGMLDDLQSVTRRLGSQ